VWGRAKKKKRRIAVRLIYLRILEDQQKGKRGTAVWGESRREGKKVESLWEGQPLGNRP